MRKTVAALVLCAFVSGAIAAPFPALAGEAIQPMDVNEAYALLSAASGGAETAYLDFLQQNGLPPGQGEYAAYPQDAAQIEGYSGTALLIHYRQTAVYIITADTGGLYTLEVEYASVPGSTADFTVSVAVNARQDYAEMANVTLPLYWRSATHEFPRDSYGDESAPRQELVEGWRTAALRDSLRVTAEPLVFPLSPGENTIALTGVSGDGLLLGKMRATPPKARQDYAQYSAFHAGEPEYGDILAVNAVSYSEKNDVEAVFESVNNPSLTPHDSRAKLLNALTWNNPGTEVTYEVNAPASGNYALTLHYRNTKQDINAYQTLLIDGGIPFAQCVAMPFPSTGGGWDNLTPGDANGPYLFYFSAGAHTVTLRLELAPVMAAWTYAHLVSTHALRFSLRIIELAGSETDRNRTWHMTRYIPEIPETLDAYAALLTHAKTLVASFTQGGAAVSAELDKALELIRGMRRYPNEIALYTNRLTGPDNSILANLSRFMTALTGNTSTPLAGNGFSLDMLYLGRADAAPPARAGFFTTVGSWFSTLLATFGSAKYKQNAGDGQALSIWVNRALSHVDLLQKMADTDFTAQTGIRVKLSAITDPGKLTMSVAAGTQPDIALGLASHVPFDLASRGALLDLKAFPDFWQAASDIPAGAFVPYLFNQGVFAVPETLDFACLVYRKDIFDALGFSVPDTWSEVAGLLPQLQRYGMNFFHNISQGTGFKWFYQTTPLIYQHGGKLYSDDGYRTAISDPQAIAGLQSLGNLFTAYSLPIQVTSFFDSFRYGTLPIGIVDSTAYILLRNGAPELKGAWALAPYPGTPQEGGAISRWFVSNGQGGVIFADTQMKDEAWLFLKWWLSAQTQTEYAQTLRSTYGDAFLWLPSNLGALDGLPIERADKDVILSSVQWLRDVPRTPGQYLLERALSDIWNSMVTQGTSAQVATDEKVVLINREIRKKMTELGFYDETGNMLKPYVVRDYDWIQAQMEQAVVK